MGSAKVFITKPTRNHPTLGVATVARGYARHYLIPNGLAVYANEHTLKALETQKQELEKANIVAQEQAINLKNQLDRFTLIFTANTGAEGKIFGSIGTKHIIKQLKNALSDIELSSRHVMLPQPIRSTGVHQVILELHPKVQAVILVSIAETMEEAQIALENFVASQQEEAVEVLVEPIMELIPMPPYD